jgi:hypothetical protein
MKGPWRKWQQDSMGWIAALHSNTCFIILPKAKRNNYVNQRWVFTVKIEKNWHITKKTGNLSLFFLFFLKKMNKKGLTQGEGRVILQLALYKYEC